MCATIQEQCHIYIYIWHSLKRLKKRRQDEVELYRYTLLCLIGGSGVDWSQDEELCKLVVALGQTSRWTEEAAHLE